MERSLTVGQIVAMVPLGSLVDALAAVPDPRPSARLRYRYATVLALFFCAMLGGARNPHAVALWIELHGAALLPVTDLGMVTVPSRKLVKVLPALVDRQAFDLALTRWTLAQGMDPGEIATVSIPTTVRLARAPLPGVLVAIAYARHVESAFLWRVGEMNLVRGARPADWTLPWWVEARQLSDDRLSLAEIVAVVQSTALVARLRALPDLGHLPGVRYRHSRLFLILCCALLGGARTLPAIEMWAADYCRPLLQALRLRAPRPPAPGTISAFVAQLDPAPLDGALTWWAAEQGVPAELQVPNPETPLGLNARPLPGLFSLSAYLRHRKGRSAPA